MTGEMAKDGEQPGGASVKAYLPQREGTVPTRAAWYALTLFTLMYVANNIDRSIMSILVEPVRHEFDLSDSQLGFLSGMAFALTYSLVGIPIGYLIDRVNRRNLLAGLMAVWSLFTALCGLAQNYWMLVTARLAVGAAEAGGAPAAMSLISDMFPKNRRSMALSIFWSSTALGTAVSFIFGGYIAVEYGWRMAFLIAGAPGLILAVVIVLTIKEPKRGLMDDEREQNEPPPTMAETWRYIVGRRDLVHAFIALGLSAVMLSGLLVWAVSFFVRTYDLGLARAGMIVGISVAVFGALGSLLGGVMGDYVFKRWGMRRLPMLPAATTLLAALASAVMAISPSLALAVGMLVLFEVTSRGYTAPGYNFLLSNVPSRMRGVAVSVVQGATNLIGYGVGPLIVGTISDATGSLSYGILALAAIGVWVSLHFYWAGSAHTDSLSTGNG